MTAVTGESRWQLPSSQTNFLDSRLRGNDNRGPCFPNDQWLPTLE